MNSTELKCPSCDHPLTSIQNKMAGVIEENSFLKKELNKLVKEKTELKLQIKHRDKNIETLKKKIDDLVKATESAFVSQQHKGEAQELLLEELLQKSFPHDQIIPVPKGKTGADCVQLIKSPSNEQIGKILFESKNTKTFSEGWLDKLKEDNLQAKAQVMILVTSAKPKDQEGKFFIQDGIWICSMDDVAELVMVLRFGLIRLHSFATAQSSRETNKDKLFDYLTSEEFRNSFEHILERFRILQQLHLQEKLKMAALWKHREVAMENILAQAIEFYSTVKGKAGVATFPELGTLEMDSQVD